MNQSKKLKLPKLIGHRGVKNLCPENTIESINKAIDLGLNYIEIDVKISKDEIPILLHDDTLDRTTNGNGIAVNYEYEFLKNLDAGKFFYNKKTNNFIPKLSDVIDLCIKRKSNLNIELKPNKNFEKTNVRNILKLTNKINDIDFFFSSFDLVSFIEISKFFSKSNRSLLIDTFNDFSIDDLISISQKYNSNICGLNIEIISSEIVKKIKKNDLIVTVFSDKNINLNEAIKCFNIGVDSIFTDDPTELLNKV